MHNYRTLCCKQALCQQLQWVNHQSFHIPAWVPSNTLLPTFQPHSLRRTFTSKWQSDLVLIFRVFKCLKTLLQFSVLHFVGRFSLPGSALLICQSLLIFHLVCVLLVALRLTLLQNFKRSQSKKYPRDSYSYVGLTKRTKVIHFQ